MRLFLISFVVLLLACNSEQSFLPKPRIYPKVIYPERSYSEYINNECPFVMNVPDYMVYLEDTLKNKNEAKFKCWFDLHSTELNSSIHFSYVDFKSRSEFDQLVADAFEMVDKHNIKASYRDEIKISFPEKRLYGLLFEIDGPVASPLQFFLTDSTQHFLRGSLYFKDEVNRDSLEPVYEFIKQDFQPMFETFRWTN